MSTRTKSPRANTRESLRVRIIRLAILASALALLSACAGHRPQPSLYHAYIKPTERLPIDGTWSLKSFRSTPKYFWLEDLVFDRGHAYSTSTGDTALRDIKQIDGRMYNCSYWLFTGEWEPCSIILKDDNTMLVFLDLIDTELTYYAKRYADKTWFMTQQADPGITTRSAPLTPTPSTSQHRIDAPIEVPYEIEKRVALVIGNASYASAPLANPANDATDMATALEMLGFEVMVATDQNRIEMKVSIRNFAKRLKQRGGVGLFYYAGHGMEVGGENYLIPIDADIPSEEYVEIEGIPMREVLVGLDSARNAMNIIILDACRNNPFARSWRASSRGLAVMQAPPETLVAYATRPGSLAADGSGRNGLYTEKLIEAMQTPGLRLVDVFRRTRAAVKIESGGAQIPWQADDLTLTFYFMPTNPGRSVSMAVENFPRTEPANRNRDHRLLAPEWWDSIGIDGYVAPEREQDGIVVVRIRPDSPAAKIGLRRGDLIVEINRLSASKLSRSNEPLGSDWRALFLIRRGKNTLFVPIVAD